MLGRRRAVIFLRSDAALITVGFLPFDVLAVAGHAIATAASMGTLAAGGATIYVEVIRAHSAPAQLFVLYFGLAPFIHLAVVLRRCSVSG